MTNIISFKDKKGLVEQKQAALNRKRKVLAVRKVFQCTQCAFKCEKCGTHIERGSEDTTAFRRKLNVPYNFCEGCSDEYLDLLNGSREPGIRTATGIMRPGLMPGRHGLIIKAALIGI